MVPIFEKQYYYIIVLNFLVPFMQIVHSLLLFFATKAQGRLEWDIHQPFLCSFVQQMSYSWL